MALDLMLTLTILFLTVVLFIWGKYRADFVALLSMTALLLSGILSPEEALSGFSNTLVIMIAGLFVVGAGIFRTGLAEMAGRKVVRIGKGKPLVLLILFMGLVAFLSAFMSNTGTVAVLMPVIMNVSLQMNISPSRFLMPVAYASSLGGVLTLIGTPPNLIVSNTLTEYGYERLGFFAFTPVGVVALSVGIIIIATFWNKLIPSKETFVSEAGRGQAPSELLKTYGLSASVFTLKILNDSRMKNCALKDLRLPNRYGITVLLLERSKSASGLKNRYEPETASAKTVIQSGDLLHVEGNEKAVRAFAQDYQLMICEMTAEDLEERLVDKNTGVAEMLLTPDSDFIGRTLQELDFRETYRLNVAAIHRKGRYLTKNCGHIKLKFGDALLVQGEWTELDRLNKFVRDFVVVGNTSEEAAVAQANGKAVHALVILTSMLLLMTFEITAPVTAVLIAALLMLFAGCLRNIDEAYSRINWESVILIGAMLPMATALEKTGGVEFFSAWLIDGLGVYGPLALLAAFYVSSMIFSQVISNTATAVLFAPIAIVTAMETGISPHPLVIAVSVATSMAFATPIASPPNAMVMTAGGYSFVDFIKAGVPLQLVIFIIMLIVIPYFFPF
ncbi:SLC13 family permease [Salisediminibacterium halotolerans]|uniref:TrkA-C domain-containing protein n=1 Tax=Salisediminibacterium halotolerans TaxID=517425 RepID=A0A1H9NYS1_9BACI|nr:SLC13 family permease [Salisediminibacterium haloalkalitolerans]SER40957.1 TrkA-C domain-containing protein [Salisediminibacterium haloalkalitolerans]